MATPRQIESARRNGAKSLGPVTPEGKAKSSRNAIKHGLAADPEVVLETEDSDNYDKLLQAYMDTYRPTSGDEYDLVCQVVSASWRLRRIGRLEASLFEDQMNTSAELLETSGKSTGSATVEAKAFRSLTYPGRSVDMLIRYTAMARRCFDTALKTLRDLQRERRALEKQNEPDGAKLPAKSTTTLPHAAIARAGRSAIAVFPSHVPPHAPIPTHGAPDGGEANDRDVKIKQ